MLRVHVLPLVFPVGFFTSSHIRLCFILSVCVFFPLRPTSKKTSKNCDQQLPSCSKYITTCSVSLCTQCSAIKLNLIILEVFINFIRQYTKKIVD